MTEKKTVRKAKAKAAAPAPVGDDTAKPVRSTKRTVAWTALGEEQRAHSEHGMHVAGEIVETDFADVLIERGFAEEV